MDRVTEFHQKIYDLTQRMTTYYQIAPSALFLAMRDDLPGPIAHYEAALHKESIADSDGTMPPLTFAQMVQKFGARRSPVQHASERHNASVSFLTGRDAANEFKAVDDDFDAKMALYHAVEHMPAFAHDAEARQDFFQSLDEMAHEYEQWWQSGKYPRVADRTIFDISDPAGSGNPPQTYMQRLEERKNWEEENDPTAKYRKSNRNWGEGGAGGAL